MTQISDVRAQLDIIESDIAFTQELIDYARTLASENENSDEYIKQLDEAQITLDAKKQSVGILRCFVAV